jgi:hypothetical protein
VIRITTLIGYLPPDGFRIKSAYRLKNGKYEVILEPWELRTDAPPWFGVGLPPIPSTLRL